MLPSDQAQAMTIPASTAATPRPRHDRRSRLLVSAGDAVRGDGTFPVKWMARQAIVTRPEHLDVSMPPGQLLERPGFGVGPAAVDADATR